MQVRARVGGEGYDKGLGCKCVELVRDGVGVKIMFKVRVRAQRNCSYTGLWSCCLSMGFEALSRCLSMGFEALGKGKGKGEG